MPYRVTYVFDAFNGREDAEESLVLLSGMLDLLIFRNTRYLIQNPRTPLLFTSGVRYEQEPPGLEDWQDIPTCLKMGACDCEDLAAWRVAELRVRFGIPARPRIIPQWLPAEERYDYHIDVWTPAGYEDPSARLGMKVR